MAIKRRPSGPQVAPGGMERREGGRVPQPRQVEIYPCLAGGLGRPIRASLTDASATSIGLTCLGRLRMGAQFVLRLNQLSGPPMLQVYHVVRCRDAGGGASLIGAQFDYDFAGACPVPSRRSAAAAAAATC